MSPDGTSPTGLGTLERRFELRAISETLARTSAGTGRLVVVEGEAGIGKSTILQRALERAATTGLRSLHATGSELEDMYPYGLAIALFEPLLRDPGLPRELLFSGPAAAAAPLFDGVSQPSGADPGDPFAMIHSLYWLALNALEAGPLLLAVDDAQWADAASLRFFHYLAQRASELSLALVLAFRTGEVATDERVVRELRTDQAALQLRPAPLSEAAVGALLAAFGQDVDPELRHAYWEASGGNPFYVTELSREMRRGDKPHGLSAGMSTSTIVPERIARFIEARVAQLDRRAQRFSEAVAILGDEATLRRAATLARLSEDEAGDVMRQLAGAAILRSTGSLAFAHPIVRAAVYRLIPEVIRARLHREAGLLLHREDAPIGAISAQLLVAEAVGDPDVVTILVDAARQARVRGEAGVAIRKLNRALEEPPSLQQRGDVLVELARAEAETRASSTVARYTQAIELVGDPVLRAALLLERGQVQINAGDWRGAAATFDLGGATVGYKDPGLRSRLEAAALSAAWVGMERPAEIDERVDRVLASRELGPDNRQLAIWIAFQSGASVSSTAAVMGELVERVLAEAPVEVLVNEGQLIEVSAGLLLGTDSLTAEIDLLTRALAVAEGAGSYAKVGVYSYCRAWPHYYTGRLTDAIADAQAAVRASELGWETFYPAACAVMALAMLERADLDGAEAILALDESRWAGRIDTAALVPLARGRLQLQRGNVSGALAELRTAGANCIAVGQRGQVPTEWRLWTVEALVRAGERDEARETAREMLEIARTWGARWTLGTATRAGGIAEGGTRGIEMLREATGLLEDSAARLELARALIDLGSALRRHGSVGEARMILSRGMDLAHRCGALALLERSRAELKAAGARPRRYVTNGVEALTPAEDRVAHLAADGRTNREIAQTLFVTPKAIEYHLANAYHKLGIGSRQDLSHALGRTR